VKYKTSREDIAYHEAGHAIATLAYGFELQTVDLNMVTQLNGDIRGGSSLMNTGYLQKDATDVQLLEKMVKVNICYLCGGVAERKYSGYNTNTDFADIKMVRKIMADTGIITGKRGVCLKYCKKRAEEFIDDNWDSVKILADALLVKGIMTCDEINSLFQ